MSKVSPGRSLFYKVAGLQPVASCKFWVILRNTFSQNSSRWLLLYFYFNTDIGQAKTEIAIHRFLTNSINKYPAGYCFVYCNKIFLKRKEYLSTKISMVKKFLIVSDSLSEKRNVYNNYFLLWITDADCSFTENDQPKM